MTAWWQGAVIYQVYPRSFKDSNHDGIGDLPGLFSQLPYLADLGVQAIWVSPFFKSPMRDFGYDISDFEAIDPMFGTLDDFDRVVVEAHRLGLKIIIDQVYSHTSDEHAWFKESRSSKLSTKADWYVWADAKADGSPPNNWQSLFAGPAWTWDARRQQYYLHNFLREQPDLNLLNTDVQDAVLATLRFWLDRGVDGIRVDAVSHFTHDPQLRDNPTRQNGGARTRPVDFQSLMYNSERPETLQFLERLRHVLNQYPERFAVGEIGGPDLAERGIADYLSADRLHTAYSFDFLRGGDLTPALIQNALAKWQQRHPGCWPTWVFSNHDAPRAISRWRNGYDPVDFAVTLNALLLSLRGSICLYQGEELGLPQANVPFERLQDPEAIANWPLTLGRDGARTPMIWQSQSLFGGFSDHEPWLPIDQQQRHAAVDLQLNDPQSVLAQTKRLIAIRKHSQALMLGEIEFQKTSGSVLHFVRDHQKESIYCYYNLGHSSTPGLDVHNGEMLAGVAVGLPVPPGGFQWLRVSR